jgi:hypothetical protein
MSTIKLNVLFKKMQKDDKKEVLMFHVVSDELPHADDLLKMPGSIVLLTVEESEVKEIGAEFVSIQRDNKKTVLKMNIKRDTEGKVNYLYPHTGNNVSLILQPSQMTIDEFYEDDHEGIKYNVDGNGNVSLNPGQLSLDEVENEDEPKLQRVK